jgi:hypothetical protein
MNKIMYYTAIYLVTGVLWVRTKHSWMDCRNAAGMVLLMAAMGG